MKTNIFLLITLTINFYGLLSGQNQQFEKITEGEIATTLRDSRSCNFIDLNNDGHDDIFITNGPSGGQNNQLFMSMGNGQFTALNNDPIVQDQSASDGASFGDVDNDGDLDAFVVTWYGERNYFYRNEGDGTFSFESNTAHAGTGTYSETCSWGDYDNDGWLDLYISNSTDFVTNAPAIKRNQLWRNQQNDTFERITTGGIVADADISRSVQWIDFDQDGDVDLFVSNEEDEQNKLYTYTDGVFTNINNAITSDSRSSTGSSWGDVDNDGDFDLFVANYANQNNQLFINNGDGTFTEVNDGALVADGGCSFGSAFGDYDNDGDLDLFITNGFCGNSLQNFLYKNDGHGNFTPDDNSIDDLSTQCSFGTAFGDYDNDGFLDLIVANCKGNNSQSQPANTLWHNLGNENNWVKFRLKGQSSNRSALGAIVRLRAQIDGQTVWQTRTVSGQSGYNGQNSLTVHFGLKEASQIDSLSILWPSGIVSSIENIGINTTHDIEEPMPNRSIDVVDPATQLQVLPNPAKDHIRIELDKSLVQQSVVVRLVDTAGSVLLEKNMENSSSLDLAVGHFPRGNYVLYFVLGEQQFTRKVVLQ